MFDQKNRRIQPKRFMWDRVKRGELMNLTIDAETTGFNRSSVPYSTPGYPAVTEYGDCLTDLNGNYLNSAQIYPRVPEWIPVQPSAQILQRRGPQDYYSDDRMAYWNAMAAMAWRIEHAGFDYEKFGDERIAVPFMDVNKAFKHGEKEAAEEVIPVPLLDQDGKIVYDVRYHPERRKVAYRVDEDPDSPYHWGGDNLFYIDEKDGSKWKWVDAGVSIDGFNFNNYDLPIFRSNLYRTGFDPVDTTFMYSRGTPTSVQRKKNHIVDIRNLAYMVALYGPQGEDGLKLGQIIDPNTGRIRSSEALGAYHDGNKGQANPLRLIKPGTFNVDDGSYFDEAMAHGAAYDATGTAALRNKCWDTAAEICATLDQQADSKKIYQVLKAQNPEGNRLPLFSLPRKEGGISHSEKPYWFLGTDDSIGKFKRVVFLIADGSLHKGEYKGKPYKDLEPEEWVEFLSLSSTRADPDSPVRLESVNKWPGVLSLEDVFNKTVQASLYRDRAEDIKRDTKYIGENMQMQENIMQALEEINRRYRFEQKMPQIPLMEDELGSQYAGEVHYQEDARALERQEIWRRTGSHKIDGILETLKGGMDNVYKSFARPIDRAGRMLALKAHAIDFYIDYDLEDTIHKQKGEDDQLTVEAEAAAAVLANFKEMAEKAFDVYKKKGCPYTKVLQSIKKDDGTPYFQGSKFQAETVGEACDFRRKLALRAMEDFTIMLGRKDSAFINGYGDKDFCFQTEKGRPLFLFADLDNGEKGATPHVVDEVGREIPLSMLKGLNQHIWDNGQDGADSMRQILKRLVDDNTWNYRFYRLRSEPTMLRMAQRFVDLGIRDEMPSPLQQLYDNDTDIRMNGFPNEDVTTSRMPTLHTNERDLERLEMAATLRDPKILERDPNPQLSVALKEMKYDEAPRILAEARAFNDEQIAKYGRDVSITPPDRHDGETGIPYDFIPHVVNRDSKSKFLKDPNFVVLDVPVWHAHYPVEQEDLALPWKGLVIPNIPKNKRDAIKDGKKVLIRVMETGQVFTTGPASVHKLHKKDYGDHPVIVEKALKDYERSGKDIDKDGATLYYLGVEDLYPVAQTRKVDLSHQTLKLPRLHFYGLTAPEYAGFGKKPLTAAIIPVDYAPQTLTPGNPLNLREVCAEMFSNFDGDTAQETGNMYETTLRDTYGIEEDGTPVGITLEELESKVRSGEIPKDVIQGAGFLGIDHFNAKAGDWITSKQKSDPGEQRVVVVTFDEVNKSYKRGGRRNEDNNSWAAVFNMGTAPYAALSWDGEPVPPTAYRNTGISPEHA